MTKKLSKNAAVNTLKALAIVAIFQSVILTTPVGANNNSSNPSQVIEAL